jgi:hypothetical protein
MKIKATYLRVATWVIVAILSITASAPALAGVVGI